MFTSFPVHFIRLIILRARYPSIDRRAPISLKPVPRATRQCIIFQYYINDDDGERRTEEGGRKRERETPSDHARLNFRVEGNGEGGRRIYGVRGRVGRVEGRRVGG